MAARPTMLLSRWAVRAVPVGAAGVMVVSPWGPAASAPTDIAPAFPQRLVASGASSNAAKAFTMAGSTTTPFGPGRAGTLVVTVRNPNNQPLQVTSISSTVGTPTGGSPRTGLPACSPTWVTVAGYRYVTGSRPVVVAAGSTATLPLSVTFTDLPTINQDNCKGVTFPISLSGTGQQTP